jgi:hypothetical protein
MDALKRPGILVLFDVHHAAKKKNINPLRDILLKFVKPMVKINVSLLLNPMAPPRGGHGALWHAEMGPD